MPAVPFIARSADPSSFNLLLDLTAFLLRDVSISHMNDADVQTGGDEHDSSNEASDSEGQQTDNECQTGSDEDEEEEGNCGGYESGGEAPRGTKSRPASQSPHPRSCML